jgi:universal stress protein A
MFKCILLATDLTENSLQVAKKAQELAKRFNAELHITHVVTPIPAYGYPGIADVEGSLIESAEKEMRELCAACNIPESNMSIKMGSIKEQVHEVAEQVNADLLVIGSHERHGLAKLLGSNANAIMHGVNCDVMVIRNNETK